MKAKTRRNWRFLYIAALAAGLSGGCPLDPSAGLDLGSGSGSSDTAGGSTQGTQTLSDQLAEQFPTCLEPASGVEWRDEVLRLVNVERARAGLDPVTHNQTLEDQATQYACEMIYYDFWGHENPVTGTDLPDRAEQFGYDYYMIGENLAAGQSSPAQAMADWMASEGHRENILEPKFTELGVGVRTGGTYGTYWVQEFGWPAGG
jgi:uncharacterized protein YkwD